MWVMRPVMFSVAFPIHVHINRSSGAGLLNAGPSGMMKY